MGYLLDDAEAHIRALAFLHSMKPGSGRRGPHFADLLQRIQFARTSLLVIVDPASLHVLVNDVGGSIRELALLILDREPS